MLVVACLPFLVMATVFILPHRYGKVKNFFICMYRVVEKLISGGCQRLNETLLSPWEDIHRFRDEGRDFSGEAV